MLLRVEAPRAVLESVMVRERATLLALARSRLPRARRGDAEDVLQDALLRALERWSQLRDAHSVGSWLRSIVVHAALDLGRTKPPAHEPFDEERWGTNEAAPESCECVVACLDELPRGTSQLLHRVTLEEEPLSRVASDLGVTSNAASVRLFRAREALRRRVKACCGATDLRSYASCRCVERGYRGVEPPPRALAAGR